MRLFTTILAMVLGASCYGQRIVPSSVSTDPTAHWQFGMVDLGPNGYIGSKGINTNGITVTSIPAPSPSATVYGTPGGTTRQYKVSALAADRETLGTSVLATTSAATLTAGNYVRLSWPAVTGATSYRVYRNVSGTYNLLATVTGVTYSDTGAVTPSATVHPQTVDQTGTINAMISGNADTATTAAGLSAASGETPGTVSYGASGWTITDGSATGLTSASGFNGPLNGNADTATTAAGLSTNGYAFYWDNSGLQWLTSQPVQIDSDLTVNGDLHGTLDGAASSVAGSGITGSHGIPDAALSTNVPLLNVNSVFQAASGATTFTIRYGPAQSTTDPFQLLNASGSVVVNINSAGQIKTSDKMRASAFGDTAGTGATLAMPTTGGALLSDATAAHVTLTINNSGPGTVDLLDVQNGGANKFTIDCYGGLWATGAGGFGVAPDSTKGMIAATATGSAPGLYIKNSGSGLSINVTNGVPTSLMSVDASGNIVSAGNISGKQLGSTAQSTSPSSHVYTPNASLGSIITVTLDAAGCTLANPTNLLAGTRYTFLIKQDSGGARTITTWGNIFKFPGGVKPTLTSTASAIDILECIYTDSVLYVTNFVAGEA